MSFEIDKKRKTAVKKDGTRETKEKVVRAAKGKAAKAPATGSSSVKQWPTHEEIASLAHRYYEERGWRHGFHEQDWYRAEQELMAS